MIQAVRYQSEVLKKEKDKAVQERNELQVQLAKESK